MWRKNSERMRDVRMQLFVEIDTDDEDQDDGEDDWEDEQDDDDDESDWEDREYEETGSGQLDEVSDYSDKYEEAHGSVEPKQTALITLDTLQALMVSLKRVELLCDYRLGFDMQFESMSTGQVLPLKIQQASLAPMVLFDGSGCHCRIRGIIDNDLARLTQNAVNSKIWWARARDWHLYQLVWFDSDEASISHTAGDYDVAEWLYKRAWTWAKKLDMYVGVPRCRDHQLYSHYINAIVTMCINRCITRLRVSLAKDGAEARTPLLEEIPQWWIEVLEVVGDDHAIPGHLSLLSMLCSGIACLGMDEIERATADFDFAKGLYCDGHSGACDHDDPKDELPLVQEYFEVSKLIHDTPEDQRLAMSEEYYYRMMEAVPRAPLPYKKIFPQTTITSAAIDSERYVLRALGYGGDLFESRILVAKDMSIEDGAVVGKEFDKLKADKAIERYKRRLAQEAKKSTSSNVWMECPFEEVVCCDQIERHD